MAGDLRINLYFMTYLGDTQALGIPASDLVIKGAIEAGIDDLRCNNWLLPYVMAGLVFDKLTRKVYGQAEISRFIEWFKATDIKVYIRERLGEPTAPSVTINLINAEELENSLADLGWDKTQEPVPGTSNDVWPALSLPFVPMYVPATGQLTLPASVTVSLYPGMAVVDGTGKIWPITAVTGTNTVTIQAGIVTNFNNSVIKAGSPAVVQTLEMCQMRENFLIGCHIQGEPTHLIYLYSLIMFVLLRGRQELLEKRGYERTFLSATDFAKNTEFQEENIFSRYINISGFTRYSWPKFRYQTITGMQTQLVLDGLANVPQDAQPATQQLWMGTNDVPIPPKSLGDFDTFGGR